MVILLQVAAVRILLKIYSIVYLQRYQKGLKRQFRKDFAAGFEDWKKAQGGKTSPQLLKGSDVILHLRTSEEHEAAAKAAAKSASNKLKTPDLTTRFELSQNTSSQHQLTQRSTDPETSHQTEFVNPNHFAKDIHTALHPRRTSHKGPEEDVDKLAEKVSEKLKIKAVPVESRIPSTTEDDPYMSYLQSVSLDIDSKPVDQFKIEATYDNCQEAYIRFLSKNCFLNI